MWWLSFFIDLTRVPKERENLRIFWILQSVVSRSFKVPVCQMSLERCISRAILKFTNLKSYFLSEGFSDERFQRLKEKFTNPLLEPALLFLSSALSLFTHFNQLLQTEESTIHILKSAIEGLRKKLAKRIMLERFPVFPKLI